MAKDQTRRLNSKELDDDVEANDALKTVTGYAPSNAQYSVVSVKALYDAMVAAQAVETQANKAAATARDKAVAAEWALHNCILGTKDQVKAQFGKDSNELQSLGLKKVSEYKRPKAKKAKPAAKA